MGKRGVGRVAYVTQNEEAFCLLAWALESHTVGSNPSLLPTSWVALFKMLNFSVPEFPHFLFKKFSH